MPKPLINRKQLETYRDQVLTIAESLQSLVKDEQKAERDALVTDMETNMTKLNRQVKDATDKLEKGNSDYTDIEYGDLDNTQLAMANIQDALNTLDDAIETAQAAIKEAVNSAADSMTKAERQIRGIAL